jgi:hypothetical protein
MEEEQPAGNASMSIEARRRLAATAGIVGPTVFAVSLILISWIQIDFLRSLGWSVWDHKESAWPSGLAQGPYGWAQIVNYAVAAVWMAMFALGLRTEFAATKSRTVATVFLLLLALSFALLAFPEDGPPFGDPTTWAGYLHAFGFLGIVLSSVGSMIAVAVALRRNPDWRPLSLFSIIAAVGVFVFLVGLVFVLEVATTIGVYGFFAVLLAWFVVLSVRLRRRSRGLPGPARS